MDGNPFKPTAGKMPPVLVGRQLIIEDFREALRDGIGAPGRIMLVTGQRGFGKTVMLTEFRKIAKSEGWLTISETASDGLVDRLALALDPQDGLRVAGAQLSPAISAGGLGSLSLGSITVSHEMAPLTLRTAMDHCLAGKRTKKGKGVLITIDEMQSASREDIVAIATAVQHVIAQSDESDIAERDKRGVAIVFAGLPSMVNELVNNNTTTFMRRAMQRELANVSVPEVRDAYVKTIGESGMDIDKDVADQAARISQGYPYMIQLVGYYVWRSARRRNARSIELQDIRQGEHDALTEFVQAVCAPAIDGLGASERIFLRAMAESSGQSGFDAAGMAKISDIVSASRHSRSWVNKYRAILLRDRIIEVAGHGYVTFAIPHLREYIMSVG